MAAPALITPAPTAAPNFGAIELRATTDFGGGGACDSVIINALTCNNGIESCFLGLVGQTTGYETAYTSCFCQYGIPYLDCFFSAISSANCAEYLSISDLQSYQIDWFTSSCGSLPPSVQAKLTAPSTVSLSFATIDIVSVNSTITKTPHTSTATYKGTGSLLGGSCSQSTFTLVDEGSTVYYAAFVGCNSDKPECCPWAAATTPVPQTITKDTTITLTTTVGGTVAPDAGGNTVGAYPVPQDAAQGNLASCADDYYSISGGCCPIGYWPFTRQVGGQTPCWSSLKSTTTAPKLTRGLGSAPSETNKPTSAVVNIVWAMQYPVAQSSSSSLSTGAIAGIAAGGGIALILVVALAFCLWRSRRKNRQLKGHPPGTTAAAAVPPMQQQQHPPMVGMAPSDPRYSTMSTSTTPHSMLQPQTTGTSAGAGTVSELSSTSTGAPMLVHGNGTASPGYGGMQTGSPQNGGYPAPIAEVDERAHQQQYPGGYFPPQGQQAYIAPGQQGVYYGQPQQQTGGYFGQSQQGMMYPPQQQQGGMYPTPPPQQGGQMGYFSPGQTPQQFYTPQQSPPVEMSGERAPHEVMGSQGQHQSPSLGYQQSPPPMQQYPPPQQHPQ